MWIFINNIFLGQMKFLSAHAVGFLSLPKSSIERAPLWGQPNLWYTIHWENWMYFCSITNLTSYLRWPLGSIHVFILLWLPNIITDKNVFHTLWKKSRLKSTYLPYRVKKHHSTLEMDTFKIMLLLSYLASLDNKPRTWF